LSAPWVGAFLVFVSVVLGMPGVAVAQETDADPQTDSVADSGVDVTDAIADPDAVPESEPEPVTVPDAGVLVPGSPTTDAATDGTDTTADDGSGAGISIDREQSSEGIKPSSVLTLVIVLLLVVGLSLAVLTVAYWLRTRPSKNPRGGAPTTPRQAGPHTGSAKQWAKQEASTQQSPPRSQAHGRNPASASSTRPGAGEPTTMIPAIDAERNGNGQVDNASVGSRSVGSRSVVNRSATRGGAAKGGAAAVSRPRPKRSDKAERDALMQRVRQDSPAPDDRPVDKASLGRASANQRPADAKAATSPTAGVEEGQHESDDEESV